MKIKSLQIQNFRNHGNTNVELEHINIFLGKNNNGKSSIKAALEYLLTNQNEFTDVRGHGYMDLIKFGEKKAILGSDIEGLGKIEKTIAKTNVCKINDKKAKQGDFEEAVEKVTGSINTLKTTFSSSRFLEMTSDEKMNFMFNLLDIYVTESLILDNLTSKKDDVINLVKKEIPAGELTLSVFDDLYKNFYASRTTVNKDVKTLKAKFEKLNDGTTDFTTVDVAALKTQIETLGTELEEKKSKLMNIEKSKETLKLTQEELNKVVNTINEIEERLNTLNKELDDEKIQDELNSISDDLTASYEELSHNQKEVASLEAQIKIAREIIEKLNGTGCPIYAGITCTQNKNEAIKELEGKESTSEDELNDFIMDVDRIKDDIKDLQDKKTELNNQLTEAREVKNLKIELDKLIIKKEELNKRIEPIDDKDCAELTQRITELTIMIEESNNLLNTKVEFDNVSAELKLKEKEQTNYDTLVGDFSPSGIKSKIINAKAPELLAKMNERLYTLTSGQYKIDFKAGDEFEIFVTHKNGTVKVKNLSESEIFRIGIILQDIFSMISNNKILVIDRLDVLDEGNRVFLNDFIKSVKDDYETIMLIGTGDETSFNVSNANYYIVEDGTVFDLFA